MKSYALHDGSDFKCGTIQELISGRYAGEILEESLRLYILPELRRMVKKRRHSAADISEIIQELQRCLKEYRKTEVNPSIRAWCAVTVHPEPDAEAA